MNIRIQHCSDQDISQDKLRRLHAVINDSYIRSERVFWGDGYERITLSGLAQLIEKKQLLVAFLDQNPIGSIQIETSHRANSGIFSMLSVDNFFRKKGLGLNLVQCAEQWAKDQGFGFMELELLIPQEFEHPDKVFLDKWYKKLGYKPFQKADFAEVHPELINILLIPCDFVVYRKVL